MQARPRRLGAPPGDLAMPARLARLLEIAAILSAQGEVRLPTWRQAAGPATETEWVASFPEAAQLRGTCRAAYGDRALRASVARMRLGRSGVTLLHLAAYMGNWEAVKEALLDGSTLLSIDASWLDVGSVPKYTDGAPLTPLAMALDGKHGSSKDCVEMLLALGASPERALEGLISSRHNVVCMRPRAFDISLISHVLELASPSCSPWLAWDVGLMLRHPGITAAATRRLVEEVPGVLAGEFDERIVWDLNEFSDKYGAKHFALLRALASNLPPRFFSDVLEAYASIEDTEALEEALDSDLAMQPAHRATALWAAAVSGMLDRVEIFFDPAVQIVSMRGPEHAWTTPLAAAVVNRHLGIVEYLVMHLTPAQCTPAEKLRASVQVGLSEQVRRLLIDHGGAIDFAAQMQDDDGMFENGAPRYILALACAEGRQDIVEMLVDAGASVHVGMDSKRDAPLIFAASGLHSFSRTAPPAERVALVKYLIRAGALYCKVQWVAFAQGKAHLDGLDVSWLDECEVIKGAVAELQMTWGDAWVAEELVAA